MGDCGLVDHVEAQEGQISMKWGNKKNFDQFPWIRLHSFVPSQQGDLVKIHLVAEIGVRSSRQLDIQRKERIKFKAGAGKTALQQICISRDVLSLIQT